MIKIFTKEDWIPPFADRPVFVVAPGIVVVTTLLAFAVIPFAPGVAVSGLDVGVLFFLAMISLGVYSVVLAGWASNSKYALIGGLRAVAQVEPSLFRRVLAFAVEHYDTERTSYHVSADMAQVPDWRDLPDEALPALLDDFHARQALHVTFGLVLTGRTEGGDYLFREAIYAVLAGDEEAHYQALSRHFARHLTPFVSA